MAPTTWTTENVLSLAPDASSASAGQGLASPKKWSWLGASERALWGLCQGSGKDPYQARVDLSEPAFKCSCPSRKFPCKHGLGLLLMFAKDAKAFKVEAEPGWVTDWLASRGEKAEKKAEKAKAAAEKPVDEAAQAKRAAQRDARVKDGVMGCRVWLEDVIRKGLAAAQVEDASVYERTAARMVDAQAPGLAAMVRRVPELIGSGEGWEARTLELLGRLHLLLCAGEQLETLPADLAGDVRSALGYNQSKEDVLAGGGGAGVADEWVTLGQIVEEEDRLRTRRTWLVGRATGRRALVLDFAAGIQPLEQTIPAGVEFKGELAFYPGRAPLRALIKVREDVKAIGPDLGGAADATIEAGLRRYAEALAANPWTFRWPLVIANARPVRDGDRWYLADSTGAALPLARSFVNGLNLWHLVSCSGGAPATVLVEWDGEAAVPVGAVNPATRAYHDLAPRWAA